MLPAPRRDAELVRLHDVRILRIEADLVERNVAHAVAEILEAMRQAPKYSR